MTSRFLRTVRALREECPTLLPVSVRRVKSLGGLYGQCRTSDALPGRFIIEVATTIREGGVRRRRTTENEQLDTLLHEFAHALAWTRESPDIDHHGPEWGLAMARVYRAVVQD